MVRSKRSKDRLTYLRRACRFASLSHFVSLCAGRQPVKDARAVRRWRQDVPASQEGCMIYLSLPIDASSSCQKSSGHRDTTSVQEVARVRAPGRTMWTRTWARCNPHDTPPSVWLGFERYESGPERTYSYSCRSRSHHGGALSTDRVLRIA